MRVCKNCYTEESITNALDEQELCEWCGELLDVRRVEIARSKGKVDSSEPTVETIHKMRYGENH